MTAFLRFSLLLLALPSPAHARSYGALEIRDWADVLFRAPDRPGELNDPALSAVTREFGPSVIPLGRLPLESEMALADAKPWSSWWFPKIDRDLFDDGLGSSPLEKYDFVRAKLTGKPSKAAAFEEKTYDPARPRWEGLCDAWAIAATIFPEPKAPRSIKLPGGATVQFSVSDQKALLLKTVDSMPPESLRTYGQRFTGNADGWIFPDLFPQELHRYVEKQLFERHKVFIMDHDPGVEVWSEPVYKANYKVTAVPGRADAVFVRLWLYSATSLTDKAQKDRPGTRELAREYDYYLYGKPDGAGNLVVDSGEWAKGDLVDSRRDHPDFVYAVTGPVKRESQNPEIDPAIVDKILTP
jgi:hypothetical protein